MFSAIFSAFLVFYATFFGVFSQFGFIVLAQIGSVI